MANDDRMTLSVDTELADELSNYGETRNEQMETVLGLARTAMDADNETNSDVSEQLTALQNAIEDLQPQPQDGEPQHEQQNDSDRLHDELREIQSKIDRLPERIAGELR
jgi:peptidoglycan hydrolase CwlO-like protein